MRPASYSSPLDRSFTPALGFGTTVAMWIVAYLGRLPGVLAPSPLILAAMLACLMGGGYLAARWSGGGAWHGARVGALASVLNLLILGSLLGGGSPGSVVPAALLWVPGSIVAGMAAAAAGAAIGSRLGPARAGVPDPTAAFAWVGVGATFFLLVVGGIVTSAEAGLAVVDWPRSYGYNMFLYPLSRMTGGIYYEHAHRLIGSLVGLTTVALAIHLLRVESRRWVKRLAMVAVVMVIAQGIAGGLRVTGRFTFAATTDATAPNLYLALFHGIFGQLFFTTMVALAIFTSVAWKGASARPSAPAGSDRRLAWTFVGALVAQLFLGATLRHFDAALLPHAGLGALLLPLAAIVGSRAIGGIREERPLRRAGYVALGLAFSQVLLGLAALFVTRMLPAGPGPGSWNVAVATAHQGVGAALLATAVVVALWTHRLRAPAPDALRASLPSSPEGVSLT